jgi:hypothetical protein
MGCKRIFSVDCFDVEIEEENDDDDDDIEIEFSKSSKKIPKPGEYVFNSIPEN